MHRATLLDGREVVVKVKYPFVEQVFDSDMGTLETFCELAQPEQVSNRKISAERVRGLNEKRRGKRRWKERKKESIKLLFFIMFFWTREKQDRQAPTAREIFRSSLCFSNFQHSNNHFSYNTNSFPS